MEHLDDFDEHGDEHSIEEGHGDAEQDQLEEHLDNLMGVGTEASKEKKKHKHSRGIVRLATIVRDKINGIKKSSKI